MDLVQTFIPGYESLLDFTPVFMGLVYFSPGFPLIKFSFQRLVEEILEVLLVSHVVSNKTFPLIGTHNLRFLLLIGFLFSFRFAVYWR